MLLITKKRLLMRLTMREDPHHLQGLCQNKWLDCPLSALVLWDKKVQQWLERIKIVKLECLRIQILSNLLKHMTIRRKKVDKGTKELIQTLRASDSVMKILIAQSKSNKMIHVPLIKITKNQQQSQIVTLWFNFLLFAKTFMQKVDQLVHQDLVKFQ